MKGLLDPKMDFVFKNIFGSEKNPKILISFLNATLKPKDLITSVEIKNTDINKNYIEDKFSRLDVKAKTSNDEIINIEIQLKNEYNMIKRSLYYWSKLYSEQLGEGQDYSVLKRTICINILNFKYLNQEELKISFIISNFSLPIDLIISSSIFLFICKVSSIKYLPLLVRQRNLSLELS